MKTLKEKIAERISIALEQSGINQKQLGERLGKSEPEISKWVSGKQNFTIATLEKIESATGIPIIICTSDLVPEKLTND